ncbi:MAG: zinc ribbon domain-containing protein [Tatlockia sp.]|nr:zinc ribbon domain-containing protein [Tatlockia sp.]
MPIYEYECKSCHHHFDLMQRISDMPAKQCPQCLEETVVRLISAAGFQLKGTGWYATDFKNKGKSESKKEETNKEKSSDSSAKPSEQKASDTTTATPAPAATSSKGDKE